MSNLLLVFIQLSNYLKLFLHKLHALAVELVELSEFAVTSNGIIAELVKLRALTHTKVFVCGFLDIVRYIGNGIAVKALDRFALEHFECVENRLLVLRKLAEPRRFAAQKREDIFLCLRQLINTAV